MIRRFAFSLISLPLLAAAQVQLEFPNIDATFTRVLPLPDGDRLLVGVSRPTSYTGLNNPPIQHYQMVLSAVGTAASNVPIVGGNGNDIPAAAAVDPSGNLWIAGETDSDDFRLVNPIVAQKVPYRIAGFVLEIDPVKGKLLFATYLAGQRQPQGVPAYYSASHATAIVIDSAGNVYVGGDTDEPDFPSTPGAYLGGKASADSFGNRYSYSFVLKISPAGKLIYSTLLGTGRSDCVGGSHCISGGSTSETVSSLAIDATGVVTAAGIVGGAYNAGGGYVSRLSSDGSKLLWTNTLPISYGAVQSISMAQDSTGNLDLFGEYAPVVHYDTVLGPTLGTPGLFAAQLKSVGSSLLYSTDLGQSTDATAAGIVLDSSGNPWLAGASSSPQFPALAGVPSLGSGFVLKLDPSGAKPQTLFRLPNGAVTAPPAFDAAGNLLLLGAPSALLTLPPNYAFDKPAVVGFANSASFALNTGIFPGTLLTLFGFDLPASPQVFIYSAPAPILYASPNQINVQVPFAILSLDLKTPVQVVSPSATLALQLPSNSSVGIFTTDGINAAALNQDQTVNSANNPAANGSIVTLYGTGAIWPSGTQDGVTAASASPLDQETNQFEIVDRTGTPLPILYAGAAPGIIDEVFQINVQLTPDVVMPLTLRSVGLLGTKISSNAVQLFLRLP